MRSSRPGRKAKISPKRLNRSMAVFATSVLSGRGEVIMSVEFEKAVQDPASVFDKPEDVLQDVSLTREQKIEILSRCE